MQSFFHTVVPWRPLPPPFYVMFIQKNKSFTNNIVDQTSCITDALLHP